MFSIKAIASLTGLSTETLRAWERRYQAIIPGRNENGRRFYSQHDLDKLALLANLTRQGHAISKISNFSVEQLRKLLNASDENTDGQRVFAEQIVEALLDYRIDRCEQLLKRALLANEPLAYLRDILTPALNHVGQLWHEEKLSIAQEHIFSACVNRILLGMVNNLHSISGNRPGMLFATPSGEPHEFGLLMCSLLAAEQHYNCYYLGANVPSVDIIAAAKKLNVEIIVLSLQKNPPDAETLAETVFLMDMLSTDKVCIWLGGRGADYWRLNRNLPENCAFIADLDGFYAKAQQRYHVD